jgi:NAD(P)-dependent dehydrogenase (short-subunit alcohol dehydrogenase family)
VWFFKLNWRTIAPFPPSHNQFLGKTRPNTRFLTRPLLVVSAGLHAEKSIMLVPTHCTGNNMDITQYFSKNLLTGKTVCVTGGGSGINLGIAKNFAAVGAKVAICGRTPEKLEAAAEEIREHGTEVFTQAADVRDYEALESFFRNTVETLGSVDVLVCGAAGTFIAPAEKLSANGFKTVVDIDLLGTFNASRAAFEHLQASRGSLIFISAGQSFIPYPFQAHAGAAKAGIDNLAKNLALEWGPYGIRCNTIVPGPIADTEGMRRLGNAQTNKKFAALIPLKRFGTVDEIGQLAVFLASPLAAYITGTVVVADGGQNLLGSGILQSLWSEAMTSQ